MARSISKTTLLACVSLIFPCLRAEWPVCVAAAESENPPAPFIVREEAGGADGSSGKIVLSIPAPDTETENPGPSPENGEPPSEPTSPPSEDSHDPPTFFGETISGKVIFVIDVSLSMSLKDGGSGEDYDGNILANMSRLDVVKTELIGMLSAFDESIAFDIVWLAGAEMEFNNSKPDTDAWRNELTVANAGNVEAAMEAVKQQQPWWGTPTWRALYRATHDYGADLSKLALLTDGAPYPPSGSWGKDQQEAILNDFPAWFAPMAGKGCSLICVHVGNSTFAADFMQSLASLNNGEYLHKP